MKLSKHKIISIWLITLMIVSCLPLFTFTVSAYDTGFKYPTAEGKVKSEWTNAGRLYASDNSKSNALNWGGAFALQDVYNFNFNIVGNIIEGIEIEMEANMFAGGGGGDCNMYFKLSGDGGSTFTAEKSVAIAGTVEFAYSVGDSTETWGKTWLPSNFTNANFLCYMRVADCDSPEICEVDCVRVKVYSNCTGPLIDNIWPDDTVHVNCTWNETLGVVVSNSTGTNVTIWLEDNDGNTSTITEITTDPQTVIWDVSGKNFTPCNTYNWGVCIETGCGWTNETYSFTIDNTESTITNIKFVEGHYSNNSNVPIIYWIYGYPTDYNDDDRLTFTLTDCDWNTFDQEINISIHFVNDTGPVWWNYSGVGAGGWSWVAYFFGKDWSVGTHKIWINVTDCGGTYSYWVNLVLVSPATTLAPTDIGYYSATLNGDWISGCGPVRGFWLGDEWPVNSSNFDVNISMDYTEILDNGQSLDLNNDSLYNTDDFVFLEYYYGETGVDPGESAYPCDLNLDRIINAADVAILVYYFGNEEYITDLNLKSTWHYSYLAWYIGSWHTGDPMDFLTLPTPPLGFRIISRSNNLVTLGWTPAITNDPDNRTTVIVYSNSSCPTNVTDGTWLVETENSSYIWDMPTSDTGTWFVSAFTNFSGNYSNGTCIAISTPTYNYVINLRHEDPMRDWSWVDLNESLIGRHKFIIHYKDGTTETNEFNKELWNLFNSVDWDEACEDFQEGLDDFEDKLEDLVRPASGMYIKDLIVDRYSKTTKTGIGIKTISHKYDHGPWWDPFEHYWWKINVNYGTDEYSPPGLGHVYTVVVYAGALPVQTITLSADGAGKLSGESPAMLSYVDEILQWSFVLFHNLDDVGLDKTVTIDETEYSDWHEDGDYSNPVSSTSTEWVAITMDVHYYNGGTYVFGLGDENSNPLNYPLDSSLLAPWLTTIWSRNPATEAKDVLATTGNIVISGEGDDQETWYFKLTDLSSNGLYPYLRFLPTGFDIEHVLKGSGIPSVFGRDIGTLSVDGTITYTPAWGEWFPWTHGLSENWTDWVDDYDCADGDANFTAWWNNVSGNVTDWLDDNGLEPPTWPSLPQYLGFTLTPGWDLETEGMSDSDPTDGKWYLNVTKEIDWVEFIWSESEEIYNISWNASDYCHRKLVIDSDMQNTETFTLWIRNDLLRSPYGWTIPGMALADYNINFLNVQEGSYAVVYCYDPDGNLLKIHSEYLDNGFAIHPMLIFGKTYYARLIEPDGNIIECGKFTAESQRDLTFDGSEWIKPGNIYEYCDIDLSFITDGFQVSFLGPYNTMWSQFQVFSSDDTSTPIYNVGPIAFLSDFDFEFTTADGYVTGDLYYYVISMEIADVGVLATPLMPVVEYEPPTIDSGQVNTFFGIMFGPSPLFLGDTHVDWIYILILILCLISLFSVVRGKEVGLIVEGIVMILSAVIAPDIGAKIGLGAIGMFLTILGVIAHLRESEEEST